MVCNQPTVFSGRTLLCHSSRRRSVDLKYFLSSTQRLRFVGKTPESECYLISSKLTAQISVLTVGTMFNDILGAVLVCGENMSSFHLVLLYVLPLINFRSNGKRIMVYYIRGDTGEICWISSQWLEENSCRIASGLISSKRGNASRIESRAERERERERERSHGTAPRRSVDVILISTQWIISPRTCCSDSGEPREAPSSPGKGHRNVN